MKIKIIDIIKNNFIEIRYYRAQHLYLSVLVNGIYYSFPVPIADIGDASVNSNDKAMLYMRWIKIALEEGTFVQYGYQ